MATLSRDQVICGIQTCTFIVVDGDVLRIDSHEVGEAVNDLEDEYVTATDEDTGEMYNLYVSELCDKVIKFLKIVEVDPETLK